MLGKVFAVLVISSFLFAGFSGNMAEVCTAAIDGANEAVTLSISLLGVMCLWSGVIRTLDKAGLTRILSKAASGLLKLIYPKVYKNTEAINNIAADYSANLLGLGNAALPIGIRAMNSLKKNGLPQPDTANDDMIMFAVLNTAPFQLMPTTLIALRSTYGSANPFEIILPIWICSAGTTVFGVILCKTFAKLSAKKTDSRSKSAASSLKGNVLT